MPQASAFGAQPHTAKNAGSVLTIENVRGDQTEPPDTSVTLQTVPPGREQPAAAEQTYAKKLRTQLAQMSNDEYPVDF